MANVELRSKRPLSPHLTVFRLYINMMMSILHRITGAANYFAIILPVAWLVAAASGSDIFALVNGLFATPLGLLVLFGASWSLIHHALGGIRHFIWDAGRGFSIPSVIKLSWATIFLSLLLTAALWFFAMVMHGRL
ncbi:MAG: succinate dehydrogenase, cytochrome b556 subunit [Alphaproteobacteria bacterium]